MKNIAKTALLALAGVALVAQSAKAATTSYTDGDIFLGIRATAGTGSDKAILIDLGQPMQFTNAALGVPFTLSLGNIAADLSATYGSDWYTSGNLLFAVVGGNVTGGPSYTDPWNTLYASKSGATPWTCNFNQGDTSSLTDQMANAYRNSASTANSTVATIQTTDQGSNYTLFQPGGTYSGGISFQTWNPTIESAINQTVYLDQMLEGSSNAGNVLGTVAIDSSANVTFDAVPEPSTYAMFGVGAAFVAMAAARRMRRTANA